MNTKNPKQAATASKEESTKKGIFDLLRFGESYTSLILGIIVIIISTVLLLSFIHKKNVSNANAPVSQSSLQVKKETSEQIAQNSLVDTATPTVKISVSPTQLPTPTIVKKPTATETPIPKQKKIAQVTVKPIKVTPTVTKLAANSSMGTHNPQSGNTYTVVTGDNLWTIAEKAYSSGYNWVDIARTNNLSNPSDIHKGDKLVIPKVEQKIATMAIPTPKENNTNILSQSTVNSSATTASNKIISTTYTVAKGDSLWAIAVRAYGDGYQWSKIAQANNLSNPAVIHSGNNLRIPRG